MSNKNKGSFYKNYDLKQAIYREKISHFRGLTKSEDNNSTFKLSQLYFFCIKFISENFLNLIKFTQKRELDVLVISNTNYKIRKIIKFLKNKKYKIGILADHQKKILIPNNKNIFLIKKYFFYKNLNTAFENYSLINKLVFFESIILFYKPKAIYLAEGDSPSEALISQICKKNNIKCYCLQHGLDLPMIMRSKLPINYITKMRKFFFKNKLSPPIIKNSFSKFYFPEFFNDFIYLCFSKQTSIFLKKNNLSNKSIVIGKKINKKFFLKDKKNILFGVPTLAEKEGLNKNVFVKLAKIINLFSKTYPEKKIIIRLHPSNSSTKLISKMVKDFDNIEYHFANEKTLKSSFESCKVAFFVYGTSLVTDALDYGSIPLILNCKSHMDFKDLGNKKIVFVFNDLEKLIFFGQKVVNHKNFYKNWSKRCLKFLKKYYN